jgi:predicted transcriptional regulator
MGKTAAGRSIRFVPERFEGLPCTAKLVWYHVLAEGVGEYPVRRLAEELGITTASAQKALAALVERGLLEVVEPAAGSRGGKYRAAP